MENMTVVTFAATAAGFVPRLAAPALDPLQGSGVSAGIGIARLRGTGVTTASEPDFASGVLMV